MGAATAGGDRTAARWAALALACAAAPLCACATAPPAARGWRDAGPTRTWRAAPGPSRAYSREQRSPSQTRARAYNRPYVVLGRQYVPAADPAYDETGVASWYGYESGRRTSNGEPFTLEGMTAAHRTLPIPSLLEVTNPATGTRVVVRLNDRGPFVEGRLIDLSHEAARRLGVLGAGSARVRVRYLGPADPGAPTLVAVAAPPSERRRGREPEPVDALQLVSDLPAAAPGGGTGGAVVQAAAFSDADRAQAAADRLARAGSCRVEPLEREDGRTFYRVMLRGEAGEGGRLREAAAALGFPDARVVAD